MQKNTCTNVVWANNKKAERETSKRSNLGETELTDIEDLENSNYLSENHEVNLNDKVNNFVLFFNQYCY